MSNQYWVEQLQAATFKEWRDDDIDTLSWLRVSDTSHDSLEEARAAIKDCGDERMSYRITDGERVWPA